MKYLGIGVTVLVIGVIVFAVLNKVSPVGWGWWGETNTSSGIALDGHDPVAYFEQGSAVQGRDDLSFEWGGAVWQFASEDNRQLFAANPKNYAPQFGGFCAFAASKGFTADPSPEAWHIEDGKLYVFADEKVRDTWVATIEEGSLKSSHDNWAKRH